MIDTTRLLRSSPFGEWVNVFYDPQKIAPKTMLELIRRRDCPRAKHTKSSNPRLLNPFIAPGDPVQIRVKADSVTTISKQSQLPAGWKVAGDQKLKKGENVVTITVPKSTRAGSHSIKLKTGENKQVKCQVTVVSQVGRH